MRIDNDIIFQAVGLEVEDRIRARNLGYVDSDSPDLITFVDNEKWISWVNNHGNIKALFTTAEMREKIANKNITAIIVDEPVYYFFKLYNYVSKKQYKKVGTRIASTAYVHPAAYVSEYNVIIGENVQIDPQATIFPDVQIGNHSIVGSSAVLGQSGYEYKRTKYGFLSVFHAGKVLIGENVEVRANTCIDKGLFSNRPSMIGDNTKINNLAMIGHGVQIGKSCLIHTCVSISGSSTIGDNVWISPNACITNGTVIGDNAFIGIGAVVIGDVANGAVVVGNPARLIRRRT